MRKIAGSALFIYALAVIWFTVTGRPNFRSTIIEDQGGRPASEIGKTPNSLLANIGNTTKGFESDDKSIKTWPEIKKAIRNPDSRQPAEDKADLGVVQRDTDGDRVNEAGVKQWEDFIDSEKMKAKNISDLRAAALEVLPIKNSRISVETEKPETIEILWVGLIQGFPVGILIWLISYLFPGRENKRAEFRAESGSANFNVLIFKQTKTWDQKTRTCITKRRVRLGIYNSESVTQNKYKSG